MDISFATTKQGSSFTANLTTAGLQMVTAAYPLLVEVVRRPVLLLSGVARAIGDCVLTFSLERALLPNFQKGASRLF